MISTATPLSMNDEQMSKLSEAYLAAVRSYVLQAPEGDLASAREIGSLAIQLGGGAADFAKLHKLSLAIFALPRYSGNDAVYLATRATEFFTEAVSAMEEVPSFNGDPLPREKTKHEINTSAENSVLLLEKSRLLEERLQEHARKIMASNEAERKQLSLLLQDEIAQTLLGLQMTLLALNKEASNNHDHLVKEINTTQRLVNESVQTITRFAREFDILPQS